MPHVACHVRPTVSINPSRWVSPTTQPPPWFVLSPHGGCSTKTAKHLGGSRTAASMHTAQPPLTPSMRGLIPSKCNRQTSPMVRSVAPRRLDLVAAKYYSAALQLEPPWKASFLPPNLLHAFLAPSLRCGEDASLEVLQRTIPSAQHIKDSAINADVGCTSCEAPASAVSCRLT